MKVQKRRELLLTVASIGAILGIGVLSPAKAKDNLARNATAITEVSGDGIRLVAVAVEYSMPVTTTELGAMSFEVAGRTVTGLFTSSSASPADRAGSGLYVIVTLAPGDSAALLAQQTGGPGPGKPPGAPGRPPAGPHGPGGMGKAGSVPPYDTVYRPAQVTITPVGAAAIVTTAIINPVVDDFRQLEFTDEHTGKLLRYNLFVPKEYDAAKSYPLVLFMHDAGATSDVTRTTLYQGLGAVVWARPEEQAVRPCFILAPQYAEIIVDDDSNASTMLDTTIALIGKLARQYSIDRARLYTTGQTGGCMMSIAMDIKYPAFFAASLLVAGQWNPELTRPLARQKLWIIVSQDDDKAYPGQNAIVSVLEKAGGSVSRAVWDGTWTPAQFLEGFEKIDRERAPINYIAFRKGTVIPPGASTAGASGHRNTWRIAYTIEPVRAWLFCQRRSA